MATSFILEIDDVWRPEFAKAKTLGEWYDLTGKAHPQESVAFDGEESFPAWHYVLTERKLESPSGTLFVGDLRSSEELVGADPGVVFHGKESVRAMAQDFRRLGKPFFEEMFRASDSGGDADVWVYEPMLAALDGASSRENAILVFVGC